MHVATATADIETCHSGTSLCPKTHANKLRVSSVRDTNFISVLCYTDFVHDWLGATYSLRPKKNVILGFLVQIIKEVK
jgi:hypothetical protein